MSLKEYGRKRKFDLTPEPRPRVKRSSIKTPLRFVVQKHAATRTHYDFRLEFDGAMKSWAVPKGPSLTSQDPRLAVKVEDHPLEYGEFEGTIPKGNYGAGTVMIWDEGTFVERGSQGRADSEAALLRGLADGHLTFVLSGKKLRGEFALVRIKNKRAEENAWLLIKKHDAEASRHDVTKEDRSVVSGRSMEEIAAQAEKKGDIWLPGKGRQGKKPSAKKGKSQVVARSPKPAVNRSPDSMPHRIRTMDAVATSAALPKGDWLFEATGMGVRAIAEVDKKGVRLYSRALIPFEKKYPSLVKNLKKWKHEAVLDGEIVTEKDTHRFVVSDLLYLDGKDLRNLPLRERRKCLNKLPMPEGFLLVASSAKANQIKLASRLSGIVAKRLDSPYRGGLTKDWQKIRANARGTKSVLESEKPPLTHLEKVYWPEEGYTKGDLIRYYDQMADTILPYLIDRPQSLHRQPDGIRNEGFFHKDMTSFLPRRIQTERVVSGSSGRTINYALCQDRWSLLYLANLGCIELNPWLSRKGNLENPDLVVIDLDPDDNSFKDVVKVALEVHRVLKRVGAISFCKTSGATGLHICIPTGAKFDFDTGRLFAEAVCKTVHEAFPKITSIERNPAKRRGRIYLDFLQNRRAQTLAAPYCVRPRPKATVSAPLKWSEVKPSLRVDSFTIKTMPSRLKRMGDLWKPLLNSSVDIEACMKRLLKKAHN